MSHGALCPHCGTIFHLESGTRCPTCKLWSVCVGCGSLKHRRDFRRLKHIDSPKVCEHRTCNDCARADNQYWEAQLKYPKGMTKQQIKRAMAAGNLRHSLGAVVLKQKKERPAFNNRGRAIWEHWAKDYAAPWLYALRRVSTEMERVRLRRVYLGLRDTAPEQAEVIFLDTYYPLLSRLRAYLKVQSKQQQFRGMANEATRYDALLLRRVGKSTFKAKAGRPIKVPHIQRERIMTASSLWEHFIKWDDLSQLLRLWPEYRDACPQLPVPLLCSASDAQRYCLHGYVRAKHTRDTSDAQQRLALVREHLKK